MGGSGVLEGVAARGDGDAILMVRRLEAIGAARGGIHEAAAVPFLS